MEVILIYNPPPPPELQHQGPVAYNYGNFTINGISAIYGKLP